MARKAINLGLVATLSVVKKMMFASVKEPFGSSQITETPLMLLIWREEGTLLRMLMDRSTVTLSLLELIQLQAERRCVSANLKALRLLLKPKSVQMKERTVNAKSEEVSILASLKVNLKIFSEVKESKTHMPLKKFLTVDSLNVLPKSSVMLLQISLRLASVMKLKSQFTNSKRNG
jgi:hypothetical protein